MISLHQVLDLPLKKETSILHSSILLAQVAFCWVSIWFPVLGKRPFLADGKNTTISLHQAVFELAEEQNDANKTDLEVTNRQTRPSQFIFRAANTLHGCGMML